LPGETSYMNSRDTGTDSGPRYACWDTDVGRLETKWHGLRPTQDKTPAFDYDDIQHFRDDDVETTTMRR